MRILRGAGEIVLGDAETKLYEGHGPEADALRRLVRRAAYRFAEDAGTMVLVRASARRGGYTVEQVLPAALGGGGARAAAAPRRRRALRRGGGLVREAGE